jgi:hypothetical protein
MANLTISVDERVIRWARIKAAELNTSVSRLVGEMLRDTMKRERGYDAARRAYLREEVGEISSGESSYPARDDLYDRADLR